MSDHFPIIAFVGKCDIKRCRLSKTIQYRHIVKDTYSCISQDLDATDWSVLHSGSLDDAYSYFSNILTDCLNRYAPRTPKSVSNKY